MKAETSHAGLMTAYEHTGPMSFDEYPDDDKQLTERSNALRYRPSEMDLQNPTRVETRQPDLLPDYSQAPPELEMLAGFEPVDSMTDKDGSRKSMLYGSDGVPWPMPDSARDPAGYTAWLSENTERARMIEQRFQAAAKPALTGGARRVAIGTKQAMNQAYGRIAAASYTPPNVYDPAKHRKYIEDETAKIGAVLYPMSFWQRHEMKFFMAMCALAGGLWLASKWIELLRL